MKTKLKAARKKEGLTQAQVAAQTQISERIYQEYESGRRTPPVDKAIRLARILHSSVEELFYLKE